MGYLPVSLDQEATLLRWEWLRSLSAPPPPDAAMGRNLRLSGRLDVAALERALCEIVRRHTALRARFFANPDVDAGERKDRLLAFVRTGMLSPGLYYQSICESAEIRLTTANLSSVAVGDQDAEVARIYRSTLNAPFDLSAPPLMRAVLIRLAPEEHQLLLAWHHMICDALSAKIVCDEIRTLYMHYSGECEYPFVTAPPGFPDFAIWQRKNIQAYTAAVSYWRNAWAYFGSARVAPSHLPFGMPPPKTPTHTYASEQVALSRSDADSMLNLARSFKVTLHMLFSVAYALVLHLYTGSPRIGFWNIFANRSLPGFQKSVGSFANPHLIGCDFSDDPTGRELLSRLRTMIAEGTGYAGMPLAFLWSTLRCYPRFPDIRPLVQTDVVNPLERLARYSGLSIQDEPLDVLPRRFSHLAVHVRACGSTLRVYTQYACDYCRKEAAQEVLNAVIMTARELAAAPDKRISESFRVLGGVSVRSSSYTDEMGHFIILDSRLLPDTGHLSIK